MFYEFKGIKPKVHPSAFVHPQAVVTGSVIIGERVYVGPGAAIRGDFGHIIIEKDCNIQENCTIHMFPGTTVVLEEKSHIGHGAIIHGARIGKNTLIGMNAVIMDDAIIGEESIVGALCFVPGQSIFPKRSVIVGNPAKVIKQVSDEMLKWKTEGTEVYIQLARDCEDSLKPCEPDFLVEFHEAGIKENKESQFKTWRKTQDEKNS